MSLEMSEGEKSPCDFWLQKGIVAQFPHPNSSINMGYWCTEKVNGNCVTKKL